MATLPLGDLQCNTCLALRASQLVLNILSHYNIDSGVLDFDDSGKKRSKRTTRINGAHKVKDKATGGYFNGQESLYGSGY